MMKRIPKIMPCIVFLIERGLDMGSNLNRFEIRGFKYFVFIKDPNVLLSETIK